EVFNVDEIVGLAVINGIGPVKHHQPRALSPREPALHPRHRIVDVDRLRSSGRCQSEQHPIQVDEVALQRLFAGHLYPERGLVLGAVPLHVVQHQLRLPGPAESPHHERGGACLGRMAVELGVDLVVQGVARDEGLNRLERRVGELARVVALASGGGVCAS
ncbi:hypothetical protein DM02DRAFT_77073, partial [Periconia macrospinosa]